MDNIKGVLIAVVIYSFSSLGLASDTVPHQTVQPMHFTYSQFKAAKRSNLPFMVAFHKKNCSRCKRQQQILRELFRAPEFMALRLLIVDFDDADLVKQFDVTFHDTLIFYRGPREVSRSHGLLEARAIKQQITG